MEEKKTVKLGDGVPEKVKENINEHMTVALTLLSNIVFDYVIEKIKTLPEVMKEFPNDVKSLFRIFTNEKKGNIIKKKTGGAQNEESISERYNKRAI